MKIVKEKTEYTIKKGGGNIVVGVIVDYDKCRCTFVPAKDNTFGFDSSDLKSIYQEMLKLESNYKKPKMEGKDDN